MNRVKTWVLLLATSSLVLFSCISIGAQEILPDIHFSVSKSTTEPPPLEVGEGPFSENMLGANVALGGYIHDTSTINMFYVNVYDGFRIRQDRLYVKERILRKPYKSIWCQIEARISKVDPFQDKNEIDIMAHKEIDMKPVFDGLKESVKWVEENRSAIDMNGSKKSDKSRRLSGDVPVENDRNKLPYRSMNEIKGIDSNRGVAEFLCGRYVLAEVPGHHAHFLDILVIYNLRAHKIIRIVIDPTGYYLE